MRFRYQRYRMKSPALPGVIINRPEISVKVNGPAGVVTLDAVVDTGSDLTLIPRWVAGQIGATVDDTRRWPLGGIAGQVIEASPGDVELEISSDGTFFRWTTAVVFVKYPAGSKATTILGHSGFLDFFRVTFDGSARELEVEVTSAFSGILS
jgi:predicted aspartyl protease